MVLHGVLKLSKARQFQLTCRCLEIALNSLPRVLKYILYYFIFGPTSKHLRTMPTYTDGSIFVRFITMREKQILESATEIQK